MNTCEKIVGGWALVATACGSTALARSLGAAPFDFKGAFPEDVAAACATRAAADSVQAGSGIVLRNRDAS